MKMCRWRLFAQGHQSVEVILKKAQKKNSSNLIHKRYKNNRAAAFAKTMMK